MCMSRLVGEVERKLASAERALARWKLKKRAVDGWHGRSYEYEDWPGGSGPSEPEPVASLFPETCSMALLGGGSL